MSKVESNKEGVTAVWECILYKCNENGSEICNEDGSLKLFKARRDFDWSHIAESFDDSDLVEFEDRNKITVIIKDGMFFDVLGLPDNWVYDIAEWKE